MVAYLVSLGIFTATFALFGLGLNLQWGFTGLINFGHVAFLALGAYATVLLSLAGVPLLIAVLAGALLAALLGLAIGISTLRLREDYLAIVTIGVAEVVRLVAVNEEWLTRGSRGVYGYPLPLAKFAPNLALKLGMIGILTVIIGLAGWQLWRWLERQVPGQPQRSGLPSRRESPWQQIALPLAYLICVILVEIGLWQIISQLLAKQGLSLWAALMMILGTLGSLACVYARLEQPLKAGLAQPKGTLLVGATTLCAGLVGMVYWALVQGLYKYSFKAGLLWLLIVVLAFVFWQLERWVNSPWGRVLKAIREDEEVAKALGKNVFAYKLQALMIGGAIAGIAGAFYAWQLTFINPDGFISLITFQAWTIVVLGGAGNNVGTLLGAAIFWAYNTVTRFVLPELVPLDDARLGALRVMVIGLLLIILMMWRPQGILGKKEELTLGR
ncbi:MAG: branched-chain amino acid ABC transporter permease [Aphanocapsa sp. GSE-SYN-MK-11-07L]|jgi:neutral amino acid transport system permease protein|nr:branched-chain amino acid ABC transporter permease [Aphanocapsa sp. GSE-SYN-MK-11-07L]